MDLEEIEEKFAKMQPVCSLTPNTLANPVHTVASSSNSNSLHSIVTPTSIKTETKLIGQPPVYIPVRTMTTTTGSVQNTVTIKRSIAPNTGANQMVTKVIFANPPPNQIASSSSSTPNEVGSKTQPQSILLASPTKTLMFSKNIVNLLNSNQILKVPPGTPTKQGMYVLSPMKTQASKLPNIATSIVKSPRRIAPATNTVTKVVSSTKLAVTASQLPVGFTKPVTIQQSPTKVMLKPVFATQAMLKSPLAISSTNTTSSTNSESSGTAAASSQLADSKFHYVRLVSAPNTSTTPTTINIKQESGVSIAATTVSSVSGTSNSQIRLAMPISASTLKKQVLQGKAGQKILIPAPTLAHLAPGKAASSSQLGQLQSGTLIPLESQSQSYVVVPSNFVTQLQQSAQSNIQDSPMVIRSEILPTTSAAAASGNQASLMNIASSYSMSRPISPVLTPRLMNGRMPIEMIDNRPRKPCNCTKSQCLKLYCDCFASGEFCNNCNCNNCSNNLHHEDERSKAIKACLDRNPLAFHPKIGKCREGTIERRHTKGCNCKRSGCLKNYCECFEAKILCTKICKCVSCKNSEESTEKKALMHLAVAAEVRVQQQAAAETNLTSQIFDLTSKMKLKSKNGGKLPIFFIIDTVIEATVHCLLSKGQEAEMQMKSKEETEKILLEEFGRCLRSVISFSNQAEGSDSECELSNA